MKNRLQFVKGFQDGTLNEEEKKILEQFPVVKKAAEESVNIVKKVTSKGGRE